MKFHLENIGCIEKADIELGNLTIICGHNNTGKTYITYSIYGFLHGIRYGKFPEISAYLNILDEKEKFIKELKEKGKIQINVEIFKKYKDTFTNLLSESYSKRLYEVFSVNENEFIESKFSIDIDELVYSGIRYHDEEGGIRATSESENRYIVTITQDNDNEKAINNCIRSIIFDYFIFYNFPYPFIITAERTGIQLFQKELDKNRSDLITELAKTRNLDLLENNVARFSLPVEHNIDFARVPEYVIKSNNFFQHHSPEIINYIEEMLGVRYQVVNGQKIVIDKNTNKTIPYYMASTSVRSLFDLHLWLKHRAAPVNHILFVDEPELNLHPANQRKMARLFVKLINNGIKVFITTHSDYIIKELNNLLMFHNDFPRKTELMKEFNITEDTILNPKDLKAYIAHDGTVSQVDIDEYGMVQSGFDDAILQINEESNEIISAIDDLFES